jgi:protein-S-isoprenylcysteine O-methyltransferase Ste14
MEPVFKTLLFTFVVPGTVAGLLPYRILTHTESWAIGPARYIGVPVFAVGVAIYVWCAGSFALKGKGTPAPIDPPKVLIVQGLYRYMRNPMYVGVLSVVLGEAIWFGSPFLFVYGCCVFGLFHTFIRFYEEPKLTELFGEQYTEYCKQVPRWLPAIRKTA